MSENSIVNKCPQAVTLLGKNYLSGIENPDQGNLLCGALLMLSSSISESGLDIVISTQPANEARANGAAAARFVLGKQLFAAAKELAAFFENAKREMQMN